MPRTACREPACPALPAIVSASAWSFPHTTCAAPCRSSAPSRAQRAGVRWSIDSSAHAPTCTAPIPASVRPDEPRRPGRAALPATPLRQREKSPTLDAIRCASVKPGSPVAADALADRLCTYRPQARTAYPRVIHRLIRVPQILRQARWLSAPFVSNRYSEEARKTTLYACASTMQRQAHLWITRWRPGRLRRLCRRPSPRSCLTEGRCAAPRRCVRKGGRPTLGPTPCRQNNKETARSGGPYP